MRPGFPIFIVAAASCVAAYTSTLAIVTISDYTTLPSSTETTSHRRKIVTKVFTQTVIATKRPPGATDSTPTDGVCWIASQDDDTKRTSCTQLSETATRESTSPETTTRTSGIATESKSSDITTKPSDNATSWMSFNSTTPRTFNTAGKWSSYNTTAQISSTGRALTFSNSTTQIPDIATKITTTETSIITITQISIITAEPTTSNNTTQISTSTNEPKTSHTTTLTSITTTEPTPSQTATQTSSTTATPSSSYISPFVDCDVSPEPMDSCDILHVIVARGTNEKPSFCGPVEARAARFGSGVMGFLADTIRKGNYDLKAKYAHNETNAIIHEVDYPASAKGIDHSLQQGAAEVQRILKSLTADANCPQRIRKTNVTDFVEQKFNRIVLLGYSQGAQIIEDALCGGGSKDNNTAWEKSMLGAPISPAGIEIINSTVAVIQVSDPRRNPLQKEKHWVGDAKGNGTIPRPIITSTDSLCTPKFFKKFRSYCEPGDPLCDTKSDVPINYERDGLYYMNKYKTDAYDFIVDELRAFEKEFQKGEDFWRKSDEKSEEYWENQKKIWKPYWDEQKKNEQKKNEQKKDGDKKPVV